MEFYTEGSKLQMMLSDSSELEYPLARTLYINDEYQSDKVNLCQQRKDYLYILKQLPSKSKVCRKHELPYLRRALLKLFQSVSCF